LGFWGNSKYHNIEGCPPLTIRYLGVRDINTQETNITRYSVCGIQKAEDQIFIIVVTACRDGDLKPIQEVMAADLNSRRFCGQTVHFGRE